VINEEPLLPYIEVRVKNKTTGVWTDIVADAITVRCSRGGTIGLANLSSVDVGTAFIRLKNVYDPAIVSFLEPNMTIQIRNKTDLAVGTVFTGTIEDVESKYERANNFSDEIITFVDIFAVDAVAQVANTSVNGVITTAGYQNWTQRIATLNTLTNIEDSIGVRDVGADGKSSIIYQG
jgi:hypothetical protein